MNDVFEGRDYRVCERSVGYFFEKPVGFPTYEVSVNDIWIQALDKHEENTSFHCRKMKEWTLSKPERQVKTTYHRPGDDATSGNTPRGALRNCTEIRRKGPFTRRSHWPIHAFGIYLILCWTESNYQHWPGLNSYSVIHVASTLIKTTLVIKLYLQGKSIK